jgi:manganese/iron transport system permease protein/iron/zinc/copper transport system permease protein
MQDPGAVAYLDDLLGHPLKDPHGQTIPEDEVCETTNEAVPFSMFRNGWEGRIHRVATAAVHTGLKTGEKIKMKARRDHGQIWVALREDGTEILLNHEVADAVFVKRE